MISEPKIISESDGEIYAQSQAGEHCNDLRVSEILFPVVEEWVIERGGKEFEIVKVSDDQRNYKTFRVVYGNEKH